MVECLQRSVELIDKMKKENEKETLQLEGEVRKIKVSLNAIMKQSHKIIKNYVATMNMMVDKLKKFQHDTLIVDLDF